MNSRIIRRKELAKRLGVTSRQTQHMEHLPGFPAKIRLGPRSVGWELAEIDEWLQSRKVTA